jgi:hypothetical protein
MMSTCPVCTKKGWILTTIEGTSACMVCINKMPPRNHEHKLLLQATGLRRRLKSVQFESRERYINLMLMCAHRVHRRTVRLDRIEGRA